MSEATALLNQTEPIHYGVAITGFAMEEAGAGERLKEALPGQITVNMPCGITVIFSSADQIPRANTPCLCGSPRHHLVWWG